MSPPRPDLVPFVASDTLPQEASAFQCTLCGTRFTHGTLVCGSCPLHAGCDVVKCPSCGFQVPRRSRIVDIARRWFGSVGAR